jgi:hypothetical protein
MTTIIPERLERLSELTILSGSHEAPPNGTPEGCVMELASWVCGLDWSDVPPCTDKRLAKLAQTINDGIEDDERRTEKMRRLVPLVIDTADREEEVKALLDRLAVRRLRETVLPLADTWPESIREEVVSAIEGVCDALEGGGDLGSAESAAGSAAWFAESAAWSAESAAWSAAESAAESARSAAYEYFADCLLELLRNAK